MSTNCLVTKLKGEVNDNNLEKLGFIRLDVKATAANAFIELFVHYPRTITIESDTAFNVATCNANSGQIITTLATGVNNYSYTMANPGDPYSLNISVPNDGERHTYHVGSKYGDTIDGIMAYTPTSTYTGIELAVKTDNLKYLTSCTRLTTRHLSGDLDNLTNMRDTLIQAIFGADVYGDANAVLGDNCQFFSINNTVASLDFDTLTRGKSLVQLAVNNNQNVKGDVMTWAAALVTAGKTSGQVTVVGFGSNATVGDIGWNLATGRRELYFGSSMTNPTAKDTARGFQVV